MRDELQDALNLAHTAPPEDLPRLLGDLEEIRATALARLSVPQPAKSADELLDVAEAAERMGVSEEYLYRNHKTLPFTRRVGRKLLFQAKGIEKHISQNR